MNFKSIKNLNLDIKQKLTLQFVLLVSILFLFFCISIYFFSDLYLEKRFFKRLQDRAITTSTLFFDLQTASSDLQKIVDETENDYLEGEVISIFESQRDLFLFTTNIGKEEFHRYFLQKLDKTNNVNYLSHLGNKMTALHIPDAENDYWILVSAIDKTGIEALQDLKNILTILSLVAILLIGLMGRYFSTKALSPISGMIFQLNSIFPKNLNQRIIHKNPEDEIGELTNTINKLLDRVETSVFTQKMFVANISHEIKNPLTKIFTQIELLEMQYKNDEALHKKITSLRDDTLKLNQLTAGILQLAGFISDQAALPMQPIRVDELLWDAISEIKKWNSDLNITVDNLVIPEDETALMTNGNFDALKVVFKNLLDNACKFSEDQSAQVQIYFDPKHIRITISNFGKLIPSEEIPNLFQPFFRVNATAKGKEGHGVGLAIVHRIVEMHQGQIKAFTHPKGNTFELTLNNL